MNLPERREMRLPLPELFEWIEHPMFGFRPFGQIVRVEEYIADHRYVVRVELLRLPHGHGELPQGAHGRGTHWTLNPWDFGLCPSPRDRCAMEENKEEKP